MLRFTRDSELGELHRILHENQPHTEEWRAADTERVRDIMAEQRSHTPSDRHRTRMSCLYVDPDDTGTAWKRPKDQTKEEAQTFLEDAANDYSVQYDHFQGGNVADVNAEFYNALQQWTGRPKPPHRMAAVTVPRKRTGCAAHAAQPPRSRETGSRGRAPFGDDSAMGEGVWHRTGLHSGQFNMQHRLREAATSCGVSAGVKGRKGLCRALSERNHAAHAANDRRCNSDYPQCGRFGEPK